MAYRCSHPEVEIKALDIFNTESDRGQHNTLLDLLDVYPDRVVWAPKLDHARLVEHFRRMESTPSRRNDVPPLRILQVSLERFVLQALIDIAVSSKTSLTSAKMMIQNCTPTRRHTGCTSDSGPDGLYRFSSGLGARMSRVWFSHSLRTDRSSVYVIHSCPEKAKTAILQSTRDENRQKLLRPLAIDAFLAEDRLDEWGRDSMAPRDELIQYENSKFSLYSATQVAMAVENLHALSQLLHVIKGHLNDLHERLRYLIKVHQRLQHLTSRRRPPYSSYPGSFEVEFDRDGADDEDQYTDSVLDSLEFMQSQTAGLIRWIINYIERTGIRINLFFNIATQTDSKINLDIARLTSKIAVSTQRDSSSMITMAAVTMFFLPGTFISALFSMVFFNTQEDGALTLSKQAWLFPAITIPLTIVIFALWLLWQRYRSRIDAKSLGLENRLTLFDDTHGTSEKDLEALLG
ncbi:hypothetical protein JR316_0013384 [Psilocybe cubensis]|uniref:Uncharacterized protein n=1 Tax=Psilocybe cubensis TaxID=181762 RepID=A0ACB8GHC0_PSICU|nr:hypothetical protein JR316_0013384 [Psilocybe cubensis]KAH9474916.1 hypothetical protein JR316_0013384 [Psilocybe cubensis]